MKKAEKTEKISKRQKSLLLIGCIFIVTGFTSFSNHPHWGYWWSGFGILLLLHALFRKTKIS